MHDLQFNTCVYTHTVTAENDSGQRLQKKKKKKKKGLKETFNKCIETVLRPAGKDDGKKKKKKEGEVV